MELKKLQFQFKKGSESWYLLWSLPSTKMQQTRSNVVVLWRSTHSEGFQFFNIARHMLMKDIYCRQFVLELMKVYTSVLNDSLLWSRVYYKSDLHNIHITCYIVMEIDILPIGWLNSLYTITNLWPSLLARVMSISVGPRFLFCVLLSPSFFRCSNILRINHIYNFGFINKRKNDW